MFQLKKNTIQSILSKDYCFIPFFPIRPIKIFNKNKNIVHINSLIRKIEIEDKLFKLNINNQEIRAKNLNLCTGSISTLDILFKSNFLKYNEVLLSDHMIGYFGQITIKNSPELIKYNFKGHLKRFFIIKLGEEKRIYLSLRPAFGIFKDIKKAEMYRSFFNDATQNIVIKLFKKIFSPLLLEAFYNKFGVYIKTNTYNLTGHIEIKNALRIKLFEDKTPDINYVQKSLKITSSEKNSFISQLSNIFNNSQIKLQNEVTLDPGLHFLNARYLNGEKLENKSFPMNVYSTMFFQDYHPQHPTFSLLVDSLNYDL